MTKSKKGKQTKEDSEDEYEVESETNESVYDEEEEIIEPGLEKEKLESKYGEEPNKTPLFDEAGNVSWNNEEYDKLWRVIPNKLKQNIHQFFEFAL